MFLSAEFFGYYIDTYIENSIYLDNPSFFYVFGVVFIVAAIFDSKFYAFEPANHGIIVDQRTASQF